MPCVRLSSSDICSIGDEVQEGCGVHCVSLCVGHLLGRLRVQGAGVQGALRQPLCVEHPLEWLAPTLP